MPFSRGMTTTWTHPSVTAIEAAEGDPVAAITARARRARVSRYGERAGRARSPRSRTIQSTSRPSARKAKSLLVSSCMSPTAASTTNSTFESWTARTSWCVTSRALTVGQDLPFRTKGGKYRATLDVQMDRHNVGFLGRAVRCRIDLTDDPHESGL